MDNYLFISRLCLATLLLAFGCLSEELKVTFQTDQPVYAQLGDAVNMTCTINRDALFIATKPVDIIHRNPATGKERKMASNTVLMVKPEFYNVQLKVNPQNSQNFDLVFFIHEVREEDDGTFICHAKNDETLEEDEAEFDFIVKKPWQEVQLHFDGHEGVTEKPEQPVEVDAGNYPVTCVAVGANPQSKELGLHLDELQIEPLSTSVELANNTKMRSYITTLTAEVSLHVKHTGAMLHCFAKDVDGNEVNSMLEIFINTYDPHVMCNDSQAHVGQMDAILTCTVNHTDLMIDGFSFQVGKTGLIIEEGSSSDENIEVKSVQLAEGITEVSLNLRKAEGWHFEEDFYIVIHSKGGHVTKQRIEMIQIEKPAGGDDNDNGDDDENDGVDDNGNGNGDSASLLDGRVSLVLSVLICFIVQLF